jgi:hypothetical protein
VEIRGTNLSDAGSRIRVENYGVGVAVYLSANWILPEQTRRTVLTAINSNERGVGQKHVLLLASTGSVMNMYIARLRQISVTRKVSSVFGLSFYSDRQYLEKAAVLIIYQCVLRAEQYECIEEYRSRD